MNHVPAPPSPFASFFTFGITRASWMVQANRALGFETSFLFTWLLSSFANYGLAGRVNAAAQQRGSTHTASPVMCFLFSGWPFFGATPQLRRAIAHLNSAAAGAARQSVAA